MTKNQKVISERENQRIRNKNCFEKIDENIEKLEKNPGLGILNLQLFILSVYKKHSMVDLSTIEGYILRKVASGDIALSEVFSPSASGDLHKADVLHSTKINEETARSYYKDFTLENYP